MSSSSHDRGQGRIAKLLEALRLQGRVLLALLLREASLRQGAHRFGHVLVLVEIIWMASVLGLLMYVLGRPAPVGTSIIFYMFTGMFPFTLYRMLHTRVAAALIANRALLNYPVIRPLDTILARAGLESAFQITAFLVFYVVLLWIGYAVVPHRPMELLAAIAGAILLGFGMGVTGMILRSLWKPWETVDNMITRVLFFISGIFFEIEAVPPMVREILLWNPMVHAIIWLRYTIFPEYFTQSLDRTYLLAWGLIATVFGLAMERLLRPRLLEQG